jgi:predicted nucleic acid-binding protein
VGARRKEAMIVLAKELPVYTCDVRDFEEIDGLEVVSIPMPA